MERRPNGVAGPFGSSSDGCPGLRVNHDGNQWRNSTSVVNGFAITPPSHLRAQDAPSPNGKAGSRARREAGSTSHFQPGNRVSGSDGCNQITGNYELKGDVIT